MEKCDKRGQIDMFRVFILLAELGVGVIFYAMVSCLIEIRKGWWRRLLLLVSCWLLVYMVIFMGDPDNLPPTLLFFLIGVWTACRGSRLKRLTVGVMFALNALFDNCVWYFLHNVTEEYAVYYFWYRALAVILLYMGVRHYRPGRDFELSPPLWRLLLMLCIPPMGIMCALILFYQDQRMNILRINIDYIPMSTVLFLVVVVSFVGNLWVMLTLNRQQQLERENALAQHNRKYYEAMEQQQFEIRRIRHDLANHLQVLLSLSAEEKDSYIRKMIENPALEKVLSYSGDATVNAVLTAKESVMRQRGISFYAKVDIPEQLPFEKPDLCALFANALDNAIEACAALDSDGKRIELCARAAKGILSVEVRNPFAGQLSGGLPETTKQDSVNHGYGLRSIQEIARKYGGDMEIRQEEGLFCLFCYVPEPSDNVSVKSVEC
ncbi:MAG: GHKL domain-containing protein [Lachnospiraceae bacterium]|nr:GHKL domain-containing protein [Lachnospiraceae bacterium]